jgi:hypothetical protein
MTERDDGTPTRLVWGCPFWWTRCSSRRAQQSQLIASPPPTKLQTTTSQVGSSRRCANTFRKRVGAGVAIVRRRTRRRARGRRTMRHLHGQILRAPSRLRSTEAAQSAGSGAGRLAIMYAPACDCVRPSELNANASSPRVRSARSGRNRMPATSRGSADLPPSDQSTIFDVACSSSDHDRR